MWFSHTYFYSPLWNCQQKKKKKKWRGDDYLYLHPNLPLLNLTKEYRVGWKHPFVEKSVIKMKTCLEWTETIKMISFDDFLGGVEQ